MKVIYISALSSEGVISQIHKRTQSNPGFAVQKFSRLLVNGFVCNNVDIIALSVPPITRQYTKRVWVKVKNETEAEIRYKYMPFINFPIIKHIWVFIYSFFTVLRWGVKTRDKKAIICDVLCISSSMGSLLASKICGIKSVAVVTDIYDQMVGKKVRGFNAFVKKLAGYLNRKYVRSFTHYVLLTEAMSDVVNPKGRPYMVMEALCDEALADEKIPDVEKAFPKVIMYAGGLEEKYGLKMLVEAFKTIDREDIELHLYGSGSYVAELVEEMKKDNRIKYLGVKPNEEVVEAEYKATLLVNPRFTTEEFTKYSFPSKNMEYMVSGTPLLTTKLPGMPEEYYPYIYVIAEESVDGFAVAIKYVLNQSEESLREKGASARDYVLNKKNNVIQAGRIVDLINGSC